MQRPDSNQILRAQYGGNMDEFGSGIPQLPFGSRARPHRHLTSPMLNLVTANASADYGPEPARVAILCP